MLAETLEQEERDAHINSGKLGRINDDKKAAFQKRLSEDEKLKIQVEAARKLLSESINCQMKISEVCRRPGGGVLNTILSEALQGQVDDMYTAQEIMNVLDELTQRKDMDVTDEDRASRSKLHAKLDAELEAYHKRKYDDTLEAGAASSSSARARRQTAEQPTQMEVDEEAAEESVDYTEDVCEC